MFNASSQHILQLGRQRVRGQDYHPLGYQIATNMAALRTSLQQQYSYLRDKIEVFFGRKNDICFFSKLLRVKALTFVLKLLKNEKK